MTDSDLTVHFVRILVVERREPRKHLKDQNTECPPIDTQVMTDTHNYFGCEIFWGSTKCKSSVFYSFGKTKVSNFEVPISGDQQVLWL